MKMKRILAVLLAGMMTATAFAGCGGDTSSEASDNASDASSSTELQVKDSIVDYSYFGDEDNVTLKVWAPDKAVNLVKQQVEDFKKACYERAKQEPDVKYALECISNKLVEGYL